jgi:antitoxin YefM
MDKLYNMLYVVQTNPETQCVVAISVTHHPIHFAALKEHRTTMNILTFSEARASLKTVMDDVCKDHTPTVVTRVNGEHVVMLSLDDFNSMEETMYLLGSANNARHLMESIAQLKAGKAEIRELVRNDKQKSKKQAKS